MNIALWIVASLLAALFFFSGANKTLQPKEKIVTSSGPWAEAFSPAAIKAIGLVEVIGALGLILPAVLDVATILVPLAATGLGVVMVGAAITHGRRGESKEIGFNMVLLIVAVFVAWGRFGPYSF
jgi:uncharacterized membrane protein